jgi:ADP-ribosylation factor-like protein 2
LTAEQIKEILGLEGAIGVHRHWKIQDCSAVSGKGLLEGVEWLVTDIASRIFMLE